MDGFDQEFGQVEGEQPQVSETDPNRRKFLQQVTGAAAGAIIMGGDVLAGDPVDGKQPEMQEHLEVVEAERLRAVIAAEGGYVLDFDLSTLGTGITAPNGLDPIGYVPMQIATEKTYRMQSDIASPWMKNLGTVAGNFGDQMHISSGAKVFIPGKNGKPMELKGSDYVANEMRTSEPYNNPFLSSGLRGAALKRGAITFQNSSKFMQPVYPSVAQAGPAAVQKFGANFQDIIPLAHRAVGSRGDCFVRATQVVGVGSPHFKCSQLIGYEGNQPHVIVMTHNGDVHGLIDPQPIKDNVRCGNVNGFVAMNVGTVNKIDGQTLGASNLGAYISSGLSYGRNKEGTSLPVKVIIAPVRLTARELEYAQQVIDIKNRVAYDGKNIPIRNRNDFAALGGG